MNMASLVDRGASCATVKSFQREVMDGRTDAGRGWDGMGGLLLLLLLLLLTEWSGRGWSVKTMRRGLRHDSVKCTTVKNKQGRNGGCRVDGE